MQSLIKKVPIKENEIIKVITAEGVSVFGVVNKIETDYFFLKAGREMNFRTFKLDFKIDQIIKLN